MATFVKYNDFIHQAFRGLHQFHAAGHTFKAILSNTAPNVFTHTVRADVTELGTGNGYTSGGIDVQNDESAAAGTATVTAVDFTWTASGGTIGPFRYVIAYNDSAASDNLVNHWDHGSSVTLQIGETFTGDFGASWFTAT